MAEEHEYRLIKELWAFEGHRIAVRYAYEWHDDSGIGFALTVMKTGNFTDDGLMQRRFACINDLPISASERLSTETRATPG